MSLYCPSCGQQSLSRIDSEQVKGPHSREISMENFDRIAKEVPAKKEIPYGLPKSKKRRIFPQKILKPKFKLSQRLKSRKAVCATIVVVLVGLYVVSEVKPGLLPRDINNVMNAVRIKVVQIAPHSKAYKLGFDEGNKDRVKDEAGKALYDQLASYGYSDVPNIDEQIKLCGTPESLWNEEDCSYLITTNSPEYKQKLYIQYAKTLWRIVGFLNSLENTQKNREDFISGFLAGKSG